MPIEIYTARAYDNPNWQRILDEITRLSTDSSQEEKDLCAQIVEVASDVVEKACGLQENLEADKYGGCLVIGKKNSQSNWPPIPVFFGGAPKSDTEFGTKNDKYIVYALAKSAVLIQNPDFVTSKQNRDSPKPEQLFIGENSVPEGGIALPNGTILSFSGFAGYVDEAICLAIAMKMNLIDEQSAKEISEKGTQKSFAIAQELAI